MTSSIQQNTPVSLKNVVIDDGFWAQRQANNREHTLPAIKHQMEKTGRVDAWKLEYNKEQTPAAGGQASRLAQPLNKVKPHIFWDSDTWMFPPLLLTHPDIARSLVAFRSRTLEAARANARANGRGGAMYPWEADERGRETTPRSIVMIRG